MPISSVIWFWVTNVYEYKVRNKALERANLNEKPVA